MRFVLILLSIFSLVLSDSVLAQSSGKLSTEGDDIKKTEILVLATPHLRQLGDDYSPVLVDSLISVLENYRPDIIGIEVVTGTQLAAMERRYPAYKEKLEYSGSGALKYGKKSQESLNISWRKAYMMADSLLNEVQNSSKITDQTRLELTNYLLAAYRFETAALQWSYVSEKGKTNQSVIPKETANVLDIYLAPSRAPEIVSIAIPLAYSLGLQRLYPIDYQLHKDFYSEIEPKISKELDNAGGPNPPYRRKLDQLMKQGIEDSTLYPLYQFMNSPAYVEQDKELQWRNDFLKTEQFNKTLRQRLALWEVRNLGIATNIREASARNPGGRVLVIIGGSHKAFLDSYLKEMMGVEVINLSDIAEK